MMRYIYHLGAHKTGSTLIQDNLAANLNALRAQGIFYVNAEMPKAITKQRKTLRQLCHPDFDAPPADALAGVNRRINTRAMRAGAHTVLLSEENRMGPPMHQELFWGIKKPGLYPSAVECLRHVTWDQPRDGMKFVLYSRDPASFVTSLYSEAVRMRQTKLSIEEFCQAVDLDSIDFDALQRRLESFDPAIEVHMQAFESLGKSGTELPQHVFRDLEIDTTHIRFQAEATRSRLDRTQIHELLDIEKRQDIRPVHRQKIRAEIIARAPDPKHRLKPPKWVQDVLR